MSSWIDPRATNYKHQKSTSTSNDNDSIGLDNSEDRIDHVKDSQEEVSRLDLAEWQDAKDCVDKQTNAEIVSRESAPGYEAGCYHRGPTAEVPVEQETDQNRQKGYSHPGKQKQEFASEDFAVLTQICRSNGKGIGNFSQPHHCRELTREVIDSDARPFVRPQEKPKGVPLALRLQELVRQAENVDSQQNIPGKRAASRNEKSRSTIEEDVIESIDSEDDLQKDTSEVPAIPATSLWGQFRKALEFAPFDMNPSSTVRPDYLACLQNALKKLKSEQMKFERALTFGRSLHGLSQCLVVLILRKTMEAQCTTCQCKVLQSPLKWNDCNSPAKAGGENVHNAPTIEVIFSSKISPKLDLEIGGVVRVHPPWQEIHGVGEFGKIILGTFYCEMLQ